MPMRGQNRPAEMTRVPSEKLQDHENAHLNPTLPHKEALSLRLALGSILAPKRPFTPSSRSSSGTASPAHPSSFPTSPLPPPPPTSTPAHGFDPSRPESYLHPRYIHLPHTPSRLGATEFPEHHWPASSSPGSLASSSPYSAASGQNSPTSEVPPLLNLPPSVVSESHHATHEHEHEARPSMHMPKPASAPESRAETNYCSPGSGTPKAKFFETLESKSAWDALIHGPFT
ncbi:hypothetical protein Hypma_001099 [Hypsizygus marmoreus]|uniref:Uncharacterized protein n=1 Tax=Hypsizygus marmoreus TaxID=39966 RepID=A0A369J6T8_HYPMA|nr:hypothetical protein Hypma_001099 [Hypsizygus marmoreus]